MAIACHYAGGLRPGQTLLLDIGRLEEIAITVAWTRDEMAGLVFSSPVDLSDARGRRDQHEYQGKFSAPDPLADRPA